MFEESAETTSLGLRVNLFTIEAIMMLSFAAFIDGGEFLLELIPGAGTILSGMLDVFALIFIGLIWMRLIRGHGITATKKTGDIKTSVARTGKKYKWLKPACMIFEMIPIVSSIAPLWIVAVFIELASSDD